MTGPDLLDAAYRLLARQAPEDDTQDTAWQAALESWATTAEAKVAAYRAVHQAANARAETLMAEAERYATAAKREQQRAERVAGLTLALLDAQEALDGTCELRLADGTLVGVKTRASTAVKVIDEREVPSRLVVRPAAPEPRVDKAAALKELRAGATIPGLELERRETRSVHWGV